MRFYDQYVCAQFWACISFGSTSVLTARGQPVGLSMDTEEFWSYNRKCLDLNSYVNHNTRMCIGVPGRVFLNQSPEWITQDVSKYNDKLCPQRQAAEDSNIRGSLFMPTIKGVVELAMTIDKDNVSSEMHEVRRAFKGVGLKSSVQNEDINIPAQSPNIRIGSFKSRSREITCKDITKLFGLPKLDAAKRCGLSEKTFAKAHHWYGIDWWPCTRSGIVKSYAHHALIEHGRTSDISSDEPLQLEQINSLLMEDNDEIECEDPLKYADAKRVGEQRDEGVLLELYQHKNKRSRNTAKSYANNALIELGEASDTLLMQYNDGEPAVQKQSPIKKPRKHKDVEVQGTPSFQQSYTSLSNHPMRQLHYETPRHTSYTQLTHTSNVDPLMDEIPLLMRQYVTKLHNVIGDGNCGFRSVAVCLGLGEDEWRTVRHELLHELTSNWDFYLDIWGLEQNQLLKENFVHFNDGWASHKHWMIMPDTGLIIATLYRIPVVFLATGGGSVTCFPLRSGPPTYSDNRIITIALIHHNHFVAVRLLEQHPVPKIHLQWNRYKLPEAAQWEALYQERLQAFRNEDVVSEI